MKKLKPTKHNNQKKKQLPKTNNKTTKKNKNNKRKIRNMFLFLQKKIRKKKHNINLPT